MLFRLYLSLHVLTAALHSLVVQVNNPFQRNMFANKGRSHILVTWSSWRQQKHQKYPIRGTLPQKSSREQPNRNISVNVLGIGPAEGRYYAHLVNRKSPVLECCLWEDVPGRWILSVIVNTTLESPLSSSRGPKHEMRARHGRGKSLA